MCSVLFRLHNSVYTSQQQHDAEVTTYGTFLLLSLGYRAPIVRHLPAPFPSFPSFPLITMPRGYHAPLVTVSLGYRVRWLPLPPVYGTFLPVIRPVQPHFLLPRDSLVVFFHTNIVKYLKCCSN